MLYNLHATDLATTVSNKRTLTLYLYTIQITSLNLLIFEITPGRRCMNPRLWLCIKTPSTHKYLAILIKVPESAETIAYAKKDKKYIVNCNNCIYYIQFESLSQWVFQPKIMLTGKGLNQSFWKEKTKSTIEEKLDPPTST